MHEIIQRDYAYSDGKLFEQWYREVNSQIRSIIEHINSTPQVVDLTPQLQQIVARLDAIESVNAQTQTDLSQIRTDIVEIQNMLASLVGTPVSPPATPLAAEFSGTVSLTSGIATFGQVIPEGQIPSGSYVKVGSLTTQNDIKTTWDDGSVRFVVLTCEPGSSGDYTLSRDNTSQASAMTPPPIPSNTYVELDIGGSVYRATCPTTHSSDKWLDGSLCVESRFEVIPILVSDGTTEHGFLSVLFDIRSYSASEYRIDVTVENTFDISGADKVTYDVDIVVNGSSVFSQSTIEHGYLARWRKKFVSGFTASTCHPDVNKFVEAKAVPQFYSTVSDNTYDMSDAAKFGILKIADNKNPMDAVGGRPEIGVYPSWCSRYLVHQTDNLLAYTLANGDLAGSWPTHCRKTPDDPTYSGLGNSRYVSLDDQPLYWWNTGGIGVHKPQGNLAGRVYFADGAHTPSFAYLPYLLTGDRYYNDEMVHWALFQTLIIWPFGQIGGQSNKSRGATGAEGLLYYNGQQRHVAWGIRNIVDAGVFAADSAVKTKLLSIVSNNLTGLDTLAAADATPLGTMDVFVSSFSGIRPQRSFSSWQLNYIAWAIDHANKMGISIGQTCKTHLVQNVVDRWNASDSDWPTDYLAPNYIDPKEYPPAGDYHTSWADVFVQTYGDVPSGSPSSPSAFVGSYGVDHRIAAMIAVQEGLTNAQDLLDFYITVVTDYESRPQWAIEVL